MELLDYLKKFGTEFDSTYETLIDEIYNNLKDNMSIDKSVDEAISSTDFVHNIEDKLMSTIIECYAINYEVSDEEELREVLLNKAWIGNRALNDRLGTLSVVMITQMKDTLKANDLLLESLADYLDENSSNMYLYNLKRKLFRFSQYDDSVLDVIEELDTLKDNVTKESVKEISAHIKKIRLLIMFGIMAKNIKSFVKNQYVRLSNTEGARAEYEALLRKTKDRDDVFGYQWVLSPIHHQFPFDICDVNAYSNVGFGKGIYPKNRMPVFPAHGHCMCRILPVYKKDLEAKVNNKFNNKAVSNYIDNLPENDRRRLFTNTNYEIYKHTKNNSLISNYGGYENPTIRA